MTTKFCTGCKETKELEEFALNAGKKDGRAIWCKVCMRSYYQEKRVVFLEEKRKHYMENPEVYQERNRTQYVKNRKQKMLHSAKRRALLRGVPFSITLADLEIPEVCPVLGIELVSNEDYGKPNSPSLDRINRELGYVPGNIVVISLKANQIKNAANMEELERVYLFFKEAGLK